MRSGRANQTGFAYALLLVLVAIVGVSAAASVTVGASYTRRAAEEQLLAVGGEFERALSSYRAATPAGNPSRHPRSLEDLLKDPRYPSLKRHLRQIYVDPMSGTDWGLVRGADDTIRGVYSTAEGMPLKQTGFASQQGHFESAGSYSDWIFGITPEDWAGRPR